SDVVRVRSEPAMSDHSRTEPSPVEAELAAVAELILTTPIVTAEADPVELQPTQPAKPVAPPRVLPWRWVVVGTIAAPAPVAGAAIGTCRGRSSNPRPPQPERVAALPERPAPDAADPPDAALDNQDESEGYLIELDPEAAPKVPAVHIAARKERSRTEAELV